MSVRRSGVDHLRVMTRGIVLPLPEIENEHLEALTELIVTAFELVAKEFPKALVQDDESDLNGAMQDEMNYLLKKNKIWSQLVQSVSRGSETRSYDGKHHELRPDLQMQLKRRHPSFPFMVEAKILDRTKRKTLDYYKKTGVSRFRTGRYGWADQSAFMLAYVRDKSSLSIDLENTLPGQVRVLPSLGVVSGFTRAETSLTRSFRYPFRDPPHDVPGPIRLHHLWFSIPVEGNGKNEVADSKSPGRRRSTKPARSKEG